MFLVKLVLKMLLQVQIQVPHPEMPVVHLVDYVRFVLPDLCDGDLGLCSGILPRMVTQSSDLSFESCDDTWNVWIHALHCKAGKN